MKYLRRVQSIVSSRALLALLVALLLASVASACPTCKDALAEADPQQKSVAVGYYYSILFMMSMPFAILGGFVGLAYLSIRRACQLPSSDENVRDEV